MIKIGIDPDVDKSGVAIIDGDEFNMYNLSLISLFENLKYINKTDKLKVYIECGFLNKSNWRVKNKLSKAANAKIAERVGANHQTAKFICEMCEYLGIDYVQVKPTKTKLNAEQFNKISGYKGRSNQEQRDAAMLIIGI